MAKLSTTMRITFTGLALLSATPVLAGWTLLPGKQVANSSGISVTPSSDWNQSGSKLGKQGVAITRDGFELNEVQLFSAVPTGGSLYKERDKKRNPMPKFDPSMLLPDLADFFERSFRVQNNLTDFTIEESTPIDFAGHRGLKVRYRYSLPNDELVRLGQARMAIVGGKFYMINFCAPRLHYFEAGLPEAEEMMDKAKF